MEATKVTPGLRVAPDGHFPEWPAPAFRWIRRMPRQEVALAPENWPESKLEAYALPSLSSFKKLCRGSCNRDYLVTWLWVLVQPSEWPRKPNWYFMLDNWPTATRRFNSQSGGYELQDLRRVAALAKRLLGEIESLRGTPLINTLLTLKEIHPEDVLHPRCDPRKSLRTLLTIGDLATRFGPQQHPGRTEVLHSLVLYVFSCHQQWHDGEVASVLEGLDLKPNNPSSLKAWRTAHGLTSTKVKDFLG
jgi:hypothetical protein